MRQRSLPTEIGDMLADAMELHPLCLWRRTSISNYHHACASLRRTLASGVRQFLSTPQTFVKLVQKHNAVFGGRIALSFIHRVERYTLSLLDLYVSRSGYEPLRDAIIDYLDIQGVVHSHIITRNKPSHIRRYLVVETLVIQLTTGKSIHVHQSYNESPCAPITRAPCTALSNFVSAHGFGCSHPELTFAHRGLLTNKLPRNTLHQYADLIDLLRFHDFSLAVSPTAWPEYRLHTNFNPSSRVHSDICWRRRHICPSACRYFGDPGSFVDFLDPLGGDEEHCKKNCLPPFGPMVIWRLMSTFKCVYGCLDLPYVVEKGVATVPVFVEGPPAIDICKAIVSRDMRFKYMYR